MTRLRGRARNVARRTRNAHLVHNRRLNRTVEEHSSDNVNLRDQAACTRTNKNSEQRNHRLRANILRKHFNERPMHVKNVTNGECKIIEH